MNRRKFAYRLLIFMLLAAIVVFSACSGKEKEAPTPQQVILEPGLTSNGQEMPASQDTQENESEQPSEEEFVDLGRATKIEDLMANKENINSYYFEQTVNGSYGEVFVRTWYVDGRMKIVSVFEDGEENTEYIDYQDLSLVSYSPAAGDYGMMMTFEPDDPDIPNNPLAYDYHQYRVLDTESISGQTCRVLEGRQSEKLWISTKHGFPLKVEFDDPTNDEHFIITYESITFNQVSYDDVAIPDNLTIYPDNLTIYEY